MAPRAGLPSLNIAIDREAVARYGINAAGVLDTIETMGGRIAGQVVEGDARYLLQVRFAQPFRSDKDRLDDIKVAAPDGKLIPLAQLAHFTLEEGPVSIWRENLTRRVTVAVNVRGTDDEIAQASRDSLRPILMASTVALFGFIPMAISHAAGAEVHRPLATVVIGGLLTSTPFTLYVLPTQGMMQPSFTWVPELAASFGCINWLRGTGFLCAGLNRQGVVE